MAFDFTSVGGRSLTAKGNVSRAKVPPKDGIWDFGWIDPGRRTDEQVAIDKRIKADLLVPFKIQGKTEYPRGGERAGLVDLWKHPTVVSALGKPFAGIHQITGSCVGAGGGNAIATLSYCEVVRLADPEMCVVPFWLLPYGLSRLHTGQSGEGEGSFGSAFAWAMLNGGVVDAKEPGLPPFQEQDGLIWGQAAEMKWSAGDRIPAEWLAKARLHLVKAFAQLGSSDQVRDAIINGYPCTCASMWGMRDPMEAQVREGYLIGTRTGQWGHQMSLLDWVDHPTLGELFLLMNQWGDCYPNDPATGGRNAVWIKKADVDWICRDEVFCPSQFNGFLARDFSWMI